MINMFISNDMYLSFIFVCPAQRLLWVYPVHVHSQSGLEVHYQISSPFKFVKVSYISVLGVAIGFWFIGLVYGGRVCLYISWYDWISVCSSVHLSLHSYVHQYVHTSIGTFIHPLVLY